MFLFIAIVLSVLALLVVISGSGPAVISSSDWRALGRKVAGPQSVRRSGLGSRVLPGPRPVVSGA
jgi:hypothetical protein